MAIYVGTAAREASRSSGLSARSGGATASDLPDSGSLIPYTTWRDAIRAVPQTSWLCPPRRGLCPLDR
jgi:hypothetical protein